MRGRLDRSPSSPPLTICSEAPACAGRPPARHVTSCQPTPGWGGRPPTKGQHANRSPESSPGPRRECALHCPHGIRNGPPVLSEAWGRWGSPVRELLIKETLVSQHHRQLFASVLNGRQETEKNVPEPSTDVHQQVQRVHRGRVRLLP